MKNEIKTKIVEEMKLYLLYTAFLTLFFCSLTTYRRLILEEYSISYLHYGYGLIEALIIAKVILIGQSLRLGGQFKDKPLIVPTLYNAIVFSFLVLIFTLIEHFITGALRGLSIEKTYQEFMSQGMDELLAKTLVVFSVFILFFAFLEIARTLGEGKMKSLFLGKTSKDDLNR